MAQTTATYSIVTPVNGDSFQMPDNASVVLLAPPIPLNTLTVTLPANPLDGQQTLLAITGAFVLLLSVQPSQGQTLATRESGVTLSANTPLCFMYSGPMTTWYRIA